MSSMSNSSCDSGLEDSTLNAVGVLLPIGQTRLSWFLAEVDEGLLKNGKASGNKCYSILHSMDLLENDIADKYLTRFVDFHINGVRMEAKLLSAADKRGLLDTVLAKMIEQDQKYDDGTQMLVQYEEEDDIAGSRLVQQTVSSFDVSWMTDQVAIGGCAFVKLASDVVGRVIYAYEKRDFMEKVLMHVKTRCFDHCFDEEMDEEQPPMDKNTWMLVQYSPEPEMVVYQVINYTLTLWHEENIYKDVIAYIPGDGAILQAVVISYGQDKQSMERKYQKLCRFALNMEFPPPEVLVQQSGRTSALFARHSSTVFQRAEQQQQQNLEQMNEMPEDDADDVFHMVDNIKKNLPSPVSTMLSPLPAVKSVL